MNRNYYQYEMLELSFSAAEPAGSHVSIDLNAAFSCGEETIHVPVFYAGGGCYKVRFLPKKAGEWSVKVSGIVEEEQTFTILPARAGHHGAAHAEGSHFVYDDGTYGLFFGTTVYALAHQTDELIDETMETLKESPFNKIRICVFPKDYLYNRNEPALYAFEKDAAGNWDPNHPCFDFWDAFERRMEQLFDMGIEVDLILFHPYDRWGFSKMTHEQDLTYLDYLMRRFMAYPGIWWSMANEYDFVYNKSLEDWYGIEEFIHHHDRFGHLLSNHCVIAPYDPGRPYQTHISWQTKQIGRIQEMIEKYHKPVFIDECCYEGDLPAVWGSLTGEEMTARFWRTYARGGYCTHGETFDPEEEDGVVFWAKGGKLQGESPARIAFLRSLLEELPGPLDPVPNELTSIKHMSEKEQEARVEAVPDWLKEMTAAINRSVNWLSEDEVERFDSCENNNAAHCGEKAFLWYFDWQASRKVLVTLPETHKYKVEVIDTWNMTRETVFDSVSGPVEVPLGRKPYMAVLAKAE